jgi:hypothetical protein
MEPLSGVIIAGLGGLGILAKNYYTDMAKLAIERSRQEQENEQRRIEKSEKYFEILLQNLLSLVGEEKDIRLQIMQEINATLRELTRSNTQLHSDIKLLIERVVSLEEETFGQDTAASVRNV